MRQTAIITPKREETKKVKLLNNTPRDTQYTPWHEVYNDTTLNEREVESDQTKFVHVHEYREEIFVYSEEDFVRCVSAVRIIRIVILFVSVQAHACCIYLVSLSKTSRGLWIFSIAALRS